MRTTFDSIIDLDLVTGGAGQAGVPAPDQLHTNSGKFLDTCQLIDQASSQFPGKRNATKSMQGLAGKCYSEWDRLFRSSNRRGPLLGDK